MNQPSVTLAVVGAGPKGVACAVKARVLHDLGIPAPRVVLVDPGGIGANWTSAGGWTDGTHRLGTSPEKDLGFPYRSRETTGRHREVDEAMQRYSWAAFLVDRGDYADWVDRGRPAPRHRDWAGYLSWAAARAGAELLTAEVTGADIVDAEPGGWLLGAVDPAGRAHELHAGALMITGPGPATAATESAHVVGPARFWSVVSRREVPAVARVAVIGGGETAGAILHELGRHEVLSIVVISPGAALYSRGEGYFENSSFTDPGEWTALPWDERRELIRRADRGVVSTFVHDQLRHDHRVSHLRGRVRGIREDGAGAVVGLERGGAEAATAHRFDLVVDARGGDPLWFTSLLCRRARDRLELATGHPVTTGRVEGRIDHDLALDWDGPALYLPHLSGPAQGPGFPNLSCLGALADRVCHGVGRRVPAAVASRVAVGAASSSRKDIP